MFLVCVRTVLRDTTRCRAISGPLSSLARRRSTSSSRSLSGSTRTSGPRGGSCGPGPCDRSSRATYAAATPRSGGRAQQGRHRRTLAGEGRQVALGLGQLEGAGHRGHRRLDVTLLLLRQGQEDEDLQHTALAPAGLGRRQQALEEPGRGGVPAGQESPRQGDVLELAQVARLVRHRQPAVRRPRERQLRPALPDPHPGPHRGDGLNIGREVAVVDPLGLVEKGERAGQVPVGLADAGLGDAPAVRVLRHPEVVTEVVAEPQVLLCAPRGHPARWRPWPARRACRASRAEAHRVGARPGPGRRETCARHLGAGRGAAGGRPA